MQTAATTAGGATPTMLGTFVKVSRNEGMWEKFWVLTWYAWMELTECYNRISGFI